MSLSVASRPYSFVGPYATEQTMSILVVAATLAERAVMSTTLGASSRMSAMSPTFEELQEADTHAIDATRTRGNKVSLMSTILTGTRIPRNPELERLLVRLQAGVPSPGVEGVPPRDHGCPVQPCSRRPNRNLDLGKLVDAAADQPLRDVDAAAPVRREPVRSGGEPFSKVRKHQWHTTRCGQSGVVSTPSQQRAATAPRGPSLRSSYRGRKIGRTKWTLC